MIYIFTAIYAEAKNIIKHYDLKKQHVAGLKFDIFSNDDIRLLITGAGAVNAAVALGNAAGVFGIAGHDRIINIGSCAMPGENAGNVYIINKITEKATGHTFYPDMLIKTELEEAAAITASIYQAASFFIAPDHVSFIKIVSDNGDLISKDEMQEAIHIAEDKIHDYIDDIKEIVQEEKVNANVKESTDYKKDIERLSDAMCCSKVMKDQLSQLIKYCYLSDIDHRAVEREFYDRKMLPCSSKKEGKVCLDKFKNRLL